MNSIAFFSMKGGTGKTTLCSSLSWILAEEGRSILMIDMDPQGHLSHFYKITPPPGRATLFGSLIYDQPLAEAILPTSHPNLFILPSSEELLDLNEALISKPWREWKLKDALDALRPFPYDMVIIDVGANLSLITYNALFASRMLIIPVLPDIFSYFSLKLIARCFIAVRISCFEWLYYRPGRRDSGFVPYPDFPEIRRPRRKGSSCKFYL